MRNYLSEQPKLDGLELTLETGAEAVHADPATVWIQHAGEVGSAACPAALHAPGGIRGSGEDDAGGPPRARVGAGCFEVPARDPAPERATGGVEARPGGGARRGRGPEWRARRVARSLWPPNPFQPWWCSMRPSGKLWSAPAKEGLPLTISAHLAAPGVARVRLRNVIGVLEGSDPGSPQHIPACDRALRSSGRAPGGSRRPHFQRSQ